MSRVWLDCASIVDKYLQETWPLQRIKGRRNECLFLSTRVDTYKYLCALIVVIGEEEATYVIGVVINMLMFIGKALLFKY